MGVRSTFAQCSACRGNKSLSAKRSFQPPSKPQFEAGKAEVDKGRGVIRDAALQESILAEITNFTLDLPGAKLIGSMDSPITGTDGNREFLLGVTKS